MAAGRWTFPPPATTYPGRFLPIPAGNPLLICLTIMEKCHYDEQKDITMSIAKLPPYDSPLDQQPRGRKGWELKQT
jgi:hypothetical protein